VVAIHRTNKKHSLEIRRRSVESHAVVASNIDNGSKSRRAGTIVRNQNNSNQEKGSTSEGLVERSQQENSRKVTLRGEGESNGQGWIPSK
jgi:hypothetical protein